MVTTTEQIVREAADIEAYKIGLLKSAKALADQGVTIPPQMVAEMSDLQIRAGELAEAGIGGYQPFLDQAGYTLGDAQTSIGGVMARAQPYQTEAANYLRAGADAVPEQIRAAQAGITNAIGAGQVATDAASMGLRTAADNARLAAQQSGVGGIGAYESALDRSNQAVRGARGITDDAASALQQAGALGTQSAQQGIAALGGTTGAFDPSSTGAFMNQYEDAAVQQALSDIKRQGDIAAQAQRAQAVGAGAFGGSRQGVQEAEMARNVLEQQGRTAAGMRHAGFENAAQRAQAAYEAQQGRGQQAAQLTGAIGAQGAQAGTQAAQAAGALGLSAEQLAAQQAGQLGQLGLSAQTAAGQQGLSAEQFAGQMASQQGQLGQSQATMGMQGAQAAGGLGLQGAELRGRMGEGIGGLGAQYGQLGLAQGDALGNLGLRQASLGELGQNMGQKESGFLFDVGKQFQAQNQAELEANRQTELQQAYEPYQRVSFLSDIYKGAPSSQQSISATTAPSVSPAQSILGLGVAGLSAAAGAQRAGLFG